VPEASRAAEREGAVLPVETNVIRRGIAPSGRSACGAGRRAIRPPVPETREGSIVTVRRRFEQLGVRPALVHALERLGIHEPTDLQAAVLPPALQGRHILAEHRDGQGRTLAYGIPVLQQIAAHVAATQALVLVPARPRAVQVAATLAKLAEACSVRVLAIQGGAEQAREARALAEQPQVLVGTADCLVDHLYRGSFRPDGVRIAVLDGAEEMAAAGLLEDADTLCSCLLGAQQYVVLAARMPQEVQLVTERYLKKPIRVREGAAEVPQTADARPAAGNREDLPRGAPPAAAEPPAADTRFEAEPPAADTRFEAEPPAADTRFEAEPAAGVEPVADGAGQSAGGAGGGVRHIYEEVGATQKAPFLGEYLRGDRASVAFVFCHTREIADRLCERLGQEGCETSLLGAELPEAERQAAVEAAAAGGQPRAVVSTEAVARGLDLSRVLCLVNFNVPRSARTYQQRAERSPAGGVVLTLVTPADRERFDELVRELELPVQSAAQAAVDPAGAPGPAPAGQTAADTTQEAADPADGATSPPPAPESVSPPAEASSAAPERTERFVAEPASPAETRPPRQDRRQHDAVRAGLDDGAEDEDLESDADDGAHPDDARLADDSSAGPRRRRRRRRRRRSGDAPVERLDARPEPGLQHERPAVARQGERPVERPMSVQASERSDSAVDEMQAARQEPIDGDAPRPLRERFAPGEAGQDFARSRKRPKRGHVEDAADRGPLRPREDGRPLRPRQDGRPLRPREDGRPRPAAGQAGNEERWRDDRFRRRGGNSDGEHEPNFNRKGVAPEPPVFSEGMNSGMLVGEHRDRWKLTDRRGRAVRRPWLSDDDRQQRLYGNQITPADRGRAPGSGTQGPGQRPWRERGGAPQNDPAFGDDRNRRRKRRRSHDGG
jgi:superfamily II DNA/RNA helicase